MSKIQDSAPLLPESARPGSDEAQVVKTAAEESVGVKMTEEQKRELMFQTLLRREEIALKKEAAEEEAKEARAKQRALNVKNRNEKNFLRQSRCDHKKGGRFKRKNSAVDYALFHHTYIDKTQVIGCFVCKMRWRPGDTDEYLIRQGRKIRNHTKIGWAKANELFAQSSNTASMSEIPQSPVSNEAYGEDIGPAEAQ